MATKKLTKRAVRERGPSKAFVLLDRTGSMADKWDEAVSAVNSYVKELKSPKVNITLACFDQHNGSTFDVLRDDVPAGGWKVLAKDEVTPRGATPLLDAMMKLITRAEEAKPKRAVLVVMTDGLENASTEVKKADLKAAIDRVQGRGWQVVYLGVGFDAFAEGGAYGIGSGSTMTASTYMDMTMMAAHASSQYFTSGTPVNFGQRTP